MKMLERESQLATLHDHAQQAAEGKGRLVFLAAESGGGKTTLVEQLAATLPDEFRMAIVSCDGLKMPGPFGPLFDIATALGPDVETLLRDLAPRDRIFRAVLSALHAAPQPQVIVGEDAHWTDEASLELIRFLGRRLAGTKTLIIVTYREDMLGPYHPLRRVLGDLINEPAVTRITLPPLSLEAVRTLAAGTGIDPVALHERTGGNPFYVTEIVAAGDVTLPDSIRDAVLARAAPLSAETRAVLDVAATIGVIFDPDLLEAVVGGPIADAVDECLASGMIRPHGDRLSFHHGLAQNVFLNVMSVPRRRELHRRILHVLEHNPAFQVSLAHLANHAEEARDTDAVLRYAPAAARQAVAFGAHREAAAQYARTLRFAHGLDARDRADLLEARAYECYLTGQLDDAVAEQEQAIALWREDDDALRLGRGLCWLSRFCWFGGRNADAERHALAALEVLEPLPPGEELAMACSNHAELRMLAHDIPVAVRWGERAISIARALGCQPILAHALANVGTARMMLDDPEGRRLLGQSLDIAESNGLHDDAARALANLAWTGLDHADLDAAETTIDRGIAFTAEHDLVAMELYLKATRARALLARGNWRGAREQAERIADLPGATTLTRIVALTVLGRIAAREGDDPAGYLDQALELALPTGQLMRLAPLRAARAEAAWLAGDPGLALAEAAAEYERAARSGDRWLAGELALWLHRGGHPVSSTGALAEPFALEIAGRGSEAAAFWRARGYPLEEARALASTGEEPALLEALAIAERLGARPDATRIVRELRRIGARRIPRGPRPETRTNPANLTAREIEVLELLVQGCSNREIADALYLSPRTVGHHVSAILAKLRIATRADAHARVAELGLLPK